MILDYKFYLFNLSSCSHNITGISLIIFYRGSLAYNELLILQLSLLVTETVVWVSIKFEYSFIANDCCMAYFISRLSLQIGMNGEGEGGQ